MSQYQVKQPVWVQIQTEEAQNNLWPAIIRQIKRTKAKNPILQYQVSLIDKEESFSNQTLLLKQQDIIPFASYILNQSQAAPQLLYAFKRAKQILEQKLKNSDTTRHARWVRDGLQKPENMKSFLWSLGETFKPISLDEQMIEALKRCELRQKQGKEYNRYFCCQILNFLINEREIDSASKLVLDDLRIRMKEVILNYIFRDCQITE